MGCGVEEQIGSRTRNESGDRTESITPRRPCLWPLLTHTFGVIFLEPGLPKVSSPRMTKYVTRRRTRHHGTWVPEVLTLPLGPRASSQSLRTMLPHP